MKGFPPDWIEGEFVFKLSYRVRNGVTEYRAMQGVNFIAKDTDDIHFKSVRLLGKNYGFLQTTKPIPKPVRKTKKRKKR